MTQPAPALPKSAVIETSEGSMTVEFWSDVAPGHVKNFTDLAKKGFYDGLIFHRVIPGFMIQGGDPLGTGTGGPGYKFKDEFHPDLKFNKPYLLAMANAGPGTNGSQFFITTDNIGQVQHLTGRHTIFGKVVEGTDVVDRISTAPTGRQDRPKDDVVVESVTIERR